MMTDTGTFMRGRKWNLKSTSWKSIRCTLPFPSTSGCSVLKAIFAMVAQTIGSMSGSSIIRCTHAKYPARSSSSMPGGGGRWCRTFSLPTISSYFSDDTQFCVVLRGSPSTWVLQTCSYLASESRPRWSEVQSGASMITLSRSQGREIASTKKRSFLSGGSSFSIICDARVSMEEITRDMRSRNWSSGGCSRRSVGATPRRCSRSRDASFAPPRSHSANSTMLAATRGFDRDVGARPKTLTSSSFSLSFIVNPASASCSSSTSTLSWSMGLLSTMPADCRNSLIVIMQIGESTSISSSWNSLEASLAPANFSTKGQKLFTPRRLLTMPWRADNSPWTQKNLSGGRNGTAELGSQSFSGSGSKNNS
mmetsp:Transcript_99855/g.282621  ORF Transcript_99855/g.282621 Transcript_99855/m.282621 type:complete len:365 (-) Transcript_99855:29-1123(-)